MTLQDGFMCTFNDRSNIVTKCCTQCYSFYDYAAKRPTVTFIHTNTQLTYTTQCTRCSDTWLLCPLITCWLLKHSHTIWFGLVNRNACHCGWQLRNAAFCLSSTFTSLTSFSTALHKSVAKTLPNLLLYVLV